MSIDHLCHQLDVYLAGELAANAAAPFEAHCTSCGECRAAIDEQRWIDGLLRSTVRVELECASPKLAKTIAATLDKSSQRAGMFTVGFAAAAVLLVAVGWAALTSRERRELTEQHVVPSTNILNVESPAVVVAPPRATVDGGPDMLVVPIESPYPDVTIVRMYPIYKPELTANISVPQRAGDALSWPESL
jgi:anti-sigma factor RsiW